MKILKSGSNSLRSLAKIVSAYTFNGQPVKSSAVTIVLPHKSN